MTETVLPSILHEVPLRHIQRIVRIVAGLEGDWSPTEVDVWSRKEGKLGFAGVMRSHEVHRPSLELYLDAAWIGLPCFERRNGLNVFDEALAGAIIDFVEASLNGAASPAGS